MIGFGGLDSAFKQEDLKNSIERLKKQQIINQLKITEQKVKAHETAHKVAGGDLTGPVRYKYTKGPDGKLYITGGEVPIRIKEGKTPEETIQIARKIRKAALAPSDPSAQDRAVASKASILEMKARIELSKYQDESSYKKGSYLSIFV
ncbi:MAG TPA: protein-glutamate O-methyltransferase [Persephonella sp.]|uniref:Protein-glutamate O-methyltransferase n=2 Tax=Persephonella marina TaxID=309805 RepID=C0QU43_PERMH|nr:putative metalloprotease CJM1_0395 family protein [Persephonella sp.]ACO03888.1 protein-glutamate O-methyltransferase [Persephonella marina EX-H1]HCB70175.1 protein-glutamate O-methyltransferase [Persephonella sp.]